MPLADRQTKFAKATNDEQAVFGLFANGVKTNRDEWVYDFDARILRDKVLFWFRSVVGFLILRESSRKPGEREAKAKQGTYV